MTTKQKLFGTDGIRGVANHYPLTPEIALQIGKAVAHHLRNGDKPEVVIGKDTRLSGYMLENALTAGLVAGGAKVFLVGPLPTPAIAHITRSFAANAGIMITASHNPANHNGIKIFDKDGFKLTDEAEKEIENFVLEDLEKRGHEQDIDEPIGKARRIDDARGRYIEYAKSTIKNCSLKGLKIVLDCANGAAYSVSPVIFQELGAEVIVLNNDPDGKNINEECGALYPEVISRTVKEYGADLGIALDGDADRVIMVDEDGKNVDGDHLLAIIAIDMKRKGVLIKNTVVGTQYTNRGFDEAMTKKNIKVERVENGDRHILERVKKKGYILGGEQSGHIILFDHGPTGDGTITALHILRIMQQSKKRLGELATCMISWPQETWSIEVSEKRPLETLSKVKETIKKGEELLGADGRIFIRYSGTEQKARIMVEAKESSLITTLVDEIENAFKKEGILEGKKGEEE